MAERLSPEEKEVVQKLDGYPPLTLETILETLNWQSHQLTELIAMLEALARKGYARKIGEASWLVQALAHGA